MQTAYARFIRLSRLISRWGRHWRRRRSARKAAVTAPIAPNVLRFKRAATGAQRSSDTVVSPPTNASSHVATASLVLVGRNTAVANPDVPIAVTSRRAVRIHRVGVGAGERIALVGRMADVCAELDRLALRERRRA